jgi:hypothetical protein
MIFFSADQLGIRCHAGPVADCSGSISYSQHDSASSLDFWIPAFAGMTMRCKLREFNPK